MPNRRRISEDAFSWVQNTTEKEKDSKPSQEAPASPKKPKATPKSTRKRSIFVEYDKKDGRIVATHEIFREADETLDDLLKEVPEGKAVVRLNLTGDLADKELIEIHKNCKVAISKKKPKLVPKS